MFAPLSQLFSFFRPADADLSSEAKAQIQGYRLLSFLGAALIPLLGVFYDVSSPGTIDPMWARLLISGLLISFLTASYVSKRVRHTYVLWMRGLVYVLMGWFVVVAALNHFEGGFEVGLLLAYAILAVVVGFGAQSAGPILRFLGFGFVITAGAVAVGSAPTSGLLLLLGRMMAVALIGGLVLWMHLWTRKELGERDERIRGLAHSIPGVVYQFYARSDGTSGLHFVSEHAKDLLGISSDPEDFFERFTERVPDSHRKELLESVETAVEQESQWSFEIPFDRPDNRRIWLLGTSTPVKRNEELVFNGVLLDITERKRADQALQAERDRFETLFENLPTPVVRCTAEDGAFYISTVNEAFEKVFGMKAPAVKEENIDELLVPEEKREEAAELAWRALKGRAQYAEVRRKAADGLRDFRLQAAGHTPEEGPPEVYVIYTDITEQKEREARLKRQNEQLDSFAGVLSHDLRNPLNVAKGRLQLAREDGSPSHLETVDRALDRMDEIIEDVLTLTWGTQDLDPENLTSCKVEEMAETSWKQVDTARATLRVEEDVVVQAHEGRLQRLLENLFRNAVEHGGKEVTVWIGSVANGLFVEDDGPGIPSEERDKAFKSGYSSNEEGTGLGLSIVRAIAEAHGWSLSVAEGSKGGARFEFRDVEPEA